MTREQICKALVYLGHQSKYWGPDQSTYAAFAAGWPITNGPCPTEVELQSAYDSQIALETSPAYVDNIKNIKATKNLNTVQNKTIFDALWELHKAIRGTITLPTETKAQYAERIKNMWKLNEP